MIIDIRIFTIKFVIISGSNSTVERAFSTLTQMLTDQRISLKHQWIEDIMLFKGNDKISTKTERDEIIERVNIIYNSM